MSALGLGIPSTPTTTTVFEFPAIRLGGVSAGTVRYLTFCHAGVDRSAGSLTMLG